MLLEPYNQTDHPECKSRPDSGLSAITELDPGYITGKLYTLLIFLSTDIAVSSHELYSRNHLLYDNLQFCRKIKRKT
jgi:hypothetical protein